MWIDVLFYLVFIVQIFLISYYYPKLMLSRMDYVYKQCPYETHNKLYPKGYEKALEGKLTFKILTRIILVIGVLLLIPFFIGTLNSTMQLHEIDFVPLVYGMVQFIPFVLLEISGFKQFRQMRQLNQNNLRNAELNPRNLFNFISPTKLIVVILINLICVYVILRSNDFTVTEEEAILIGSLLLSNLLYVGSGYFLIHGKKLDPHQSIEDRQKSTKTVIQTYAATSILVSIFFIVNRCVEHFALSDWEAIFNSIYWQLVIVLSFGTMFKNIQINEVNFDVYRTPLSPQKGS